MVWSQLAGISTPPIVTTDFLYIRFIGDRTIQEKDFAKIQRDRVSEMKKWARFLKRARGEQRDRLNLAIVTAWTTNDFDTPKTGEELSGSNTKQITLSDIMNELDNVIG